MANQPDDSDHSDSLRLRVQGMDCPGCGTKVESAVSRVPGVDEVSANVAAGTVIVTPAGGSFDRQAVLAAIRGLGYGIAPEQDASSDSPDASAGTPWWHTPKGRLVLGSGILLVLAIGLELAWPVLGDWPFVAATLVGLVPIARTAWQMARLGEAFTIEMLMTIAAAGALAIDAAAEAAVVVFLFAVGELLEGVAATHARRSISALSDLTPRTARLWDGDSLREVSADALEPGQRVQIRPGERLPCDGRILAGTSSLDESPVSGESVPRDKGIGDEVLAGTVNLDAALTVEVTRGAADNTIARIIRLVEEAQESKAPVARFIDRFARIYMPAVVALALAVAILPPLALGAAWSEWVYRALALLLIACPCALVISTPAAIAAGLSNGARRGLLIKGGAVLETLGSIRAVALDKTGTLTTGKPCVTDLCPGEADERELLYLVAGLEQASSHPIAQAVVAHAAECGIAPAHVEQAHAIAGQGVAGRIEGIDLMLLNPRGADARVPLGASHRASVEQFENEGKSVAVLIDGARVLGLVALRDEPREDARAGLAALSRLGVTGIMLTGDNPRTARAIAGVLGIDAHAGLMPEDKARWVNEWRASGRGPIGKVGDGINDAPALAAADIGIAMGGGTDVAIETADAALLRNRVTGIAELIALSRATLANIHTNVALALGLKGIFLITTIFGITGMWIAVMADTGATVLVTLNAMRLLRHRFEA
ncbi:Cd2+/Zn2+-exporting ATPase [Modicisalibacter ilicicola DSM 19980]|uniref:P-type Zn(2+) transporter n=1 Tax=Modicisalibacter ilicicola DSM 19980 TaxID=1121942 RepID=A0A1M4W954_9GAMM|nr:heavy metal translocating P-type ATPase [Halomonas ilicicola]SHE77739.1 Cd2+/Zn2+-exporting ATPase [Halomonas ilicicola DSM 19980]